VGTLSLNDGVYQAITYIISSNWEVITLDANVDRIMRGGVWLKRFGNRQMVCE